MFFVEFFSRMFPILRTWKFENLFESARTEKLCCTVGIQALSAKLQAPSSKRSERPAG
jgi:hypothetical protein